MTKMVQLSDDAYARLKALKRRDESFSDVVLRLAPKGDLKDLWKIGRSKKQIDEAARWIERITETDRPG
jgi:predicted CopG family antitoxin